METDEMVSYGVGVLFLLAMEEEEALAYLATQCRHRFWVRPWLRRRGNNRNTVFTLMTEMCNVSFIHDPIQTK